MEKKNTNTCYNCANENKFFKIKFDKIKFNINYITKRLSRNHITDKKKKL